MGSLLSAEILSMSKSSISLDFLSFLKSSIIADFVIVNIHAKISVKPGTHVILKVTRKTDSTCATEIKITEKKIKKDLPLNKEVSADVGVLEKGQIKFACGMNMITGYIIAE